MGDKTNIEWADSTWNPIVGCSIVSHGCTNCYAMKWAAQKLDGQVPHYEDTTKKVNGNAVWTGKVALAPDHILTAPLRWKKPRRVFVNSMGDLFHESVPDEWIDKVFAVMALTPQHTFQCLTKRANRMRAYCSAPDVTHRVAKAIDAIQVDREHDPNEVWLAVPGYEPYEASSHGRVRRDGEVLREQINPLYGRPSVTIWISNEPTTIYVHKLVLLAHRGQPAEGEEAGHRNGNPADNRLANLRWITRAQNQAEKVRHGSSGGPAKLTRDQASEIRLKRRAGAKQQALADEYGVSRSLISMIESGAVWPDALNWPLPNCWLGVSAEDQQRADERIPDLLATPAAVRFVSAEPLLGPVNLGRIRITPNHHTIIDALDGYANTGGPQPYRAKLDWVIVGGESGPRARPMHPDWARQIRDQCVAAGTPFFFKQWGEYSPPWPLSKGNYVGFDRVYWCETPGLVGWSDFEPKGAGYLAMDKHGKARAGRLLDGIEHNGFPEVKS
jgi:protein gp37